MPRARSPFRGYPRSGFLNKLQHKALVAESSLPSKRVPARIRTSGLPVPATAGVEATVVAARRFAAVPAAA